MIFCNASNSDPYFSTKIYTNLLYSHLSHKRKINSGKYIFPMFNICSIILTPIHNQFHPVPLLLAYFYDSRCGVNVLNMGYPWRARCETPDKRMKIWQIFRPISADLKLLKDNREDVSAWNWWGNFMQENSRPRWKIVFQFSLFNELGDGGARLTTFSTSPSKTPSKSGKDPHRFTHSTHFVHCFPVVHFAFSNHFCFFCTLLLLNQLVFLIFSCCIPCPGIKILKMLFVQITKTAQTQKLGNLCKWNENGKYTHIFSIIVVY